SSAVLKSRAGERDVTECEPTRSALAVAHEERTAIVKAQESASDVLSSRVDAEALTNLAGPAEPGSPHARETGTQIPRRDPALDPLRQEAQHRLWLDIDAVRRQVRSGTSEPARVRHQVDADAEHYHGLRALRPDLALGQYARTLGLADQDIVGPLQPQAGNRSPRRRGNRLHGRDTGKERELMHDAVTANQSLQQAGVEVAGLRSPLAAGAPPPLALAPRHDPQWPGLSCERARERLRIG